MQPLEEYLKKAKSVNFPDDDKLGYADRYSTISKFLNEYVHPTVTRLADIANLGTADEGFLTDHGPAHIETVIKRAGALTQSGKNKFRLEPYEAYCLLLAIHIHDVGNQYGRRFHEVKSDETLMKLGPLAGDSREHRIIWQIAEAHGGYTKTGDKDKISQLAQEVSVVDSFVINQQFIAAILRLADELADYRNRAVRYTTGSSSILKQSEIYHAYAYSLQSVNINLDLNAIELQYQLDEENATKLLGKGSSEVFLLDEIYSRTMKMYTELRYCDRFIRDRIKLNRIKVSIDCHSSKAFSWTLHPPIHYVLEESGYPNLGSITQLCNISVDGTLLRDKVLTELGKGNE